MRRASAQSNAFGASFAPVQSRVSGLTKSLIGLAGAGGALGLAGVAMKKSVDAASNLNESINAVGVTFGKAGEKITAFGENAARTTGLSARQVNESATVLGAALQNVGFNADQAAERTIALTQRAADMASVFNTDVNQALGAIQAALRGESDPIERFGVGLNEAAVAAKALELGLADTTKEITAQDKAQARLALIMEQTNKVAGDFANTSDGAANQQRILRAEVENLSAQLGAHLLPIVSDVLEKVLDWTQRLEDNKELQIEVKDAVEDLTNFTQDFVRWAGRAADALGGWDDAIKLAFGLFLFKKLADLALGLEKAIGKGGTAQAPGTGVFGVSSAFRLALPLAVAAGVGQALKNFEPFSDAVDAVVKKVGRLGGELPSGTGGITLIGPDGNPIDARGRSVIPGSPGATGRLTGGIRQQQQVLNFARQFGPGSGITYTWGGVSPQTGFDCSGYLWAAYKAAGITIPRDSRSQWNDPNAMHVPPGQEAPGDGVYFAGSRTGANAGPPPGHVGIYIGGGKFIEYFSRGKPARVNSLGARSDYMGARRWLYIRSSSGGGGGRTERSSTQGITVANLAETSTTAGTRARTGAGFQAIPVGLRVQLAAAGIKPGDADDLRILQKIRANLKAQLDSKKLKPEDRLEVINALKDINSQIERIEDKHADKLKEKARKKREAMLSAFKGVAAAALREFDKATQAGLAQFDALTPAEKELAEFRKRRADEERQQRRLDALAIEDPYEREQALRRLDLEDQEAALEARAQAERDARDKEREDYEKKRDEDRTRLEVWLDQQEKALSDGRKSWERFYKDLRAIAIRYGFPVGPLGAAPAATPQAARAATSGLLPGAGSAAGGHIIDSGPIAPAPTVIVNVAGSVQAEQDLATTIRNTISSIGLRNDGTGL